MSEKLLWVVDTHIGCSMPKIERYTYVKQAKRGYVVKRRGVDVHIRDASYRRFFVKEDDMWMYVRRFVEDSIGNAIRATTRYTKLLEQLGKGDVSGVEINAVPDGSIPVGYPVVG